MNNTSCLPFLGSILMLIVLPAQSALSQDVPQYFVDKASSPLVIDGRLNESAWDHANLTAPFSLYGRTPHFRTQAKMLYDDSCLYVGFICDDSDVWSTYTQHDGELYKNDVVEVFIDPDGDGLNYCEIEVNPLNVVADLTLNKPYSDGGSGNWTWDLAGFRSAVIVEGTVNDQDSLDYGWLCEMAIPYKGISFLAPTVKFPPSPRDTWRIQLARLDYQRTGTMAVEPTSWSPTDSVHGFHVPSEFGYVTCGFDPASVKSNAAGKMPGTFLLLDCYPNPFNPSAHIRYSVGGAMSQTSSHRNMRLVIYDVLGRQVAVLLDQEQGPGTYEVPFDGSTLAGGVYFCRLIAGNQSVTRPLLLQK